MSHCWVLGHWILQDGREEKKRRFLSGLFSGPGGKDYQSFPTAHVHWRKKERKRKKKPLICDAERTHPITQPLEPNFQTTQDCFLLYKLVANISGLCRVLFGPSSTPDYYSLGDLSMPSVPHRTLEGHHRAFSEGPECLRGIPPSPPAPLTDFTGLLLCTQQRPSVPGRDFSPLSCLSSSLQHAIT